MSQSRQLAAIMFTENAKYTALMDEDEQKTFELLKKNRQVQRPIIEKHNATFLGEQQLKNVKKPIRIYSMQAESTDPVIPRSSTNSQRVLSVSWGPTKMTVNIAGVYLKSFKD